MMDKVLKILQTDDPLTTFLAFAVFTLASVILYMYKNTVPKDIYKGTRDRAETNMQLIRKNNRAIDKVITLIEERL